MKSGSLKLTFVDYVLFKKDLCTYNNILDLLGEPFKSTTRGRKIKKG